MKPESQRIAIAEACGHLNPRQSDSGAFFASYARNADGKYWGTHGIPDYLNSLDAMHEAEKVLMDHCDGWGDYCHKLRRHFVTSDGAIRATAAQRAEAFLRTLNLYTDES